ncbi:hypothetical protein [Streptomyces sp. V1I6]|uniref:hypothetical protein n=1 Tax=Streptomyces sp. V1I6 TaxID=3042273 RepID=UPI00277EE1A4|nr:hypothetical protein [Streptomyces sp. V1I6]MDQ0846400.1 hypothetical protein [Streptomyces sp. V1I6]
MRTALPLITAGTVLLTGAGASAAAPVDEPTPAEGPKIVLDDGRVVGVDDTPVLTAAVTGSEGGGYAYAYYAEKKRLP